MTIIRCTHKNCIRLIPAADRFCYQHKPRMLVVTKSYYCNNPYTMIQDETTALAPLFNGTTQDQSANTSDDTFQSGNDGDFSGGGASGDY